MTTTILADDGTYCVRVVDDMPKGVRGTTVIDEDGFANIYINARLGEIDRRRALAHELRHIGKDDGFNSKSILDIEDRRADIPAWKRAVAFRAVAELDRALWGE